MGWTLSCILISSIIIILNSPATTALKQDLADEQNSKIQFGLLAMAAYTIDLQVAEQKN